jgi:hypothetical protein
LQVKQLEAIHMAPSPTAPAVNAPAPGCGAEWLDLLHTGEALLLAGLRRKIGPTGDLRAAYRQWYREQMIEHDRLVAQTYDRLDEAFGERGDAS